MLKNKWLNSDDLLCVQIYIRGWLLVMAKDMLAVASLVQLFQLIILISIQTIPLTKNFEEYLSLVHYENVKA